MAKIQSVTWVGWIVFLFFFKQMKRNFIAKEFAGLFGWGVGGKALSSSVSLVLLLSFLPTLAALVGASPL